MKYKSQGKQLTIEDFRSSLEQLPQSNRWVMLGDNLPWEDIEKLYNAKLNNHHTGAGNKSAHTYRYFKGEVRYPFGYGLSYTEFSYSNVKNPSSVNTGETVIVEATVKNSGIKDGDEVVQLYVVHPKNNNTPIPTSALKGFKRIYLKKGESQNVSFLLTPEELGLTDKQGNLVQKESEIQIYIGGGQPNKSTGQSSKLQIVGEPYIVY